MIKLTDIIKEIEYDEVSLYHATFNDLVPYIQRDGLVPNGKLFKNFEDIEWGVYLSNDWLFAGSMAQATENKNIPDRWLDEIVILAIDPKKLDLSKLEKDPQVNISSGDTKSYIYKGIIPPIAIIEIFDYEQ
jgi:hypothetical protein